MPVPGKSAREINARAQLYEDLAREQLSQPDFAALNLAIAPGTSNILAECYFALSEAYKIDANRTGSRTEWVKSAALIATAVSVVNPLRPAGRCDKLEAMYANPAFGLLCAYGHARKIFVEPTFDQRRRLFQALRGARFPSLDAIIAEGNRNNGVLTTTWKLELVSGELSFLKMTVSKFHSLCRNDCVE